MLCVFFWYLAALVEALSSVCTANCFLQCCVAIYIPFIVTELYFPCAELRGDLTGYRDRVGVANLTCLGNPHLRMSCIKTKHAGVHSPSGCSDTP